MSDRHSLLSDMGVAVAAVEAAREPSANAPIVQLLGWAVRERRRAADVPQAELARRTGMTRQQLSALEAGDARRRVGLDRLRQVDTALDAGGSLLRLVETGKSTGRTLVVPAPKERLALTLAARRDPGLVPMDQRLLLNALDLRQHGLLHSSEAERTVQAALALNSRISTTQNQTVLLALRVLGPAALSGLADALDDDRQVSPWRALAALPHLSSGATVSERDAGGRSNVGILLHLAKRSEGNAHLVPWTRPLVDALALLEERKAFCAEQRHSAASFLRRVVADDDQFPESRYSAGRLLSKLEPEASDAPKYSLPSASIESTGKPPEVPYEWLAALRQAAAPSRTRLSLLLALIAGGTEERRRQAALVLLAAGLGRWSAEVYEQLAGEVSPAGLSYILRNPLGLLAQSITAPLLLRCSQHADPVVRAHAAWALSRQASLDPTQKEGVRDWLLRETQRKDGAYPTLALRQIVRDLHWQYAPVPVPS